MDKALNYLSLARKGGMAELGEEPVAAITRTGKGYLVIVASDASDHTWRRAKSLVEGTDQQCIRVPYTKDELGFVIGRTSLALAAITDAALACALVKSLPNPEKYANVAETLENKATRLRQRQKEAKAHKRNVSMGKRSKQ